MYIKIACVFLLLSLYQIRLLEISMIKAIFFDIDGTLVSFNTHVVPQSTIESLNILREKGVKVFIATGRHPSAINNLGDLRFDGYVTVNGGYCIAGTDEVIYKHSICNEDVEALLHYMETTEAFPCAFVHEKDVIMNYTDEAVEHVFQMLNFPAPPCRPLSEVRGKDVFQLISFFTATEEKRIMNVMPHCESTRWNPLFTDVVPVGSSKSVGIDKMLEYFGLALDECMAFGDGGNDVSMLRHAGIGVAMGNAGEEVKEVADYVTDTVDEDGIFKALKHFGII